MATTMLPQEMRALLLMLTGHLAKDRQVTRDMESQVKMLLCPSGHLMEVLLMVIRLIGQNYDIKPFVQIQTEMEYLTIQIQTAITMEQQISLRLVEQMLMEMDQQITLLIQITMVFTIHTMRIMVELQQFQQIRILMEQQTTQTQMLITMEYTMQQKEEIVHQILMAMVQQIITILDLQMPITMEWQTIQNLLLSQIVIRMVQQITQNQIVITMAVTMQQKLAIQMLMEMEYQEQQLQHSMPMEQQIQREQVQEDTIHQLILMAIVLRITQKLDQTMHQLRHKQRVIAWYGMERHTPQVEHTLTPLPTCLAVIV